MERKEEKERLEKGKASTQNRKRQRVSGEHNADGQSETERGLCVQTGQGKPLVKAQQTEDAVMKTVMQVFAEELLPYLGIEGEAVRIAPTELVYLELKKLFQAARAADGIEPEEVQKLEAVMYAMAEKFLEEVDLEQLRREIGMTRIGQMLVQEGWETGREAGWKVGQEDSKLEIAANLLDILDVETIAERVGLPVEKVIELKEGK